MRPCSFSSASNFTMRGPQPLPPQAPVPARVASLTAGKDVYKRQGYIDPEFEDLFENFAFHEVIIEDGCNVAAHSRFLAILATLVGAGATDEYSLMMPAALNFGVIPEDVYKRQSL